MQINYTTHSWVCLHGATTVTLTHCLAPWRHTRKHIFQKIPARLCAGGLIHYSLLLWDSPPFIMLNTLSRTHTHMLHCKYTCLHNTLFIHTCHWAYTVQTASVYSQSLSHTHTFSCRHCGHWIIMLPPGETDRCVSMWVCVCQALRRPPSWYLLVRDSWGARDLYLALPANYHTHIQSRRWRCAISPGPPTSFSHLLTLCTKSPWWLVGLNRSLLPF